MENNSMNNRVFGTASVCVPNSNIDTDCNKNSERLSSDKLHVSDKTFKYSVKAYFNNLCENEEI